MPALAIVGSTTQDVVREPDGTVYRKPGGSPLFAIQALAEAGFAAGIATRCSDARLVAPLVPLAQPLCVRLDDRQVVSVLSYRRDGERDHELADPPPAWTGEDVEGWAAPALKGARWVHAGTQRGADLTAEAVAALRDGGRRIALDAQGPLRQPHAGPVRLSDRFDADLLRAVQVLKLGEEEALAAYGTCDATDIAERCGVPEVLVTLGRRGSRVAAGEAVGDLAADVVDDVQPTGAGDAFLALYMAAREGGAAPLDAAARATDGVARLLRRRKQKDAL
jgi:fructokinase